MDITAGAILLTLFWGVAVGCVYMLLASGLNIIFGVMKLVNFAHGQLLMIGAYFTWTISVCSGLERLRSNSLFPWRWLRCSESPLNGSLSEGFWDGDKLNEIFVSLGLIYIFENAALLFWGDQSQRITSPFSGMSFEFARFLHHIRPCHRHFCCSGDSGCFRAFNLQNKDWVSDEGDKPTKRHRDAHGH